MPLKNLALSIVLILTASLSAAEAETKTKQVVTLTSDPWPPYVLGELGKEATGGLGVEIMHRIFARIEGVDVRFPPMPWKRALRAVKQGTMDGIAVLLKTPEREQYMEYTDVLLASPNLLWYSTRRFPAGFEWERFEDFAPYNLAVVRGHSYGEEIDKVIEAGFLRVTEVTSAEQMFTMLARGRIDLALANAAVGFALVKKYAHVSKIIAVKKPAAEHIYYVALSKKSPARQLIPAMNRIISDLKREGVIEKIIRNE